MYEVFVGFIILTVLAIVAKASYENGACDGYLFSKEPDNPGAYRAKRIIKDRMSHRYAELRTRRRS